MSKADGRPARPGEVPAFGSVWVWKAGTIHYIALGLTPPNGAGWRMLTALVAEIGRSVDSDCVWSTDGQPLADWRCVAEAPK